jgi:hypothetical protein
MSHQRMFMDSLHHLAAENGIDHQSMSSAEVFNQLSAEQQQALHGLVEQTATQSSPAAGSSTFTPPDIGDPSQSEPVEEGVSQATISEVDSQKMMHSFGNLPLSDQRAFMESLHQVAHEHGIDINDLKSHEIISQLPEDQVASLQALATSTLASSISASEAVNAITSQTPEIRYELVSQLRTLAEYSNIDFNNTPPEELLDRLPVESKAELLGNLYSLTSAASAASELNDEALAASTQIGNDALEQQQTAAITANTLGGWLSQKTQGAISWAKAAFVGAPTDTGSPIESATATAGMEDSTTNATGRAVALSMIAKKVASREGYEKPSFPDVLDNPPQGRVTQHRAGTSLSSPDKEGATAGKQEQGTKALGQETKANSRSVTKTPGM